MAGKPEVEAAGCLHELVEAQVKRTPAAVAVSGEGGRLTYADLDRRARSVASRLHELGVGPEAVVAVLLERSLELPVALLGVLEAGAAYLPLDPDLPADRLRWMLEDAGAVALLTESRLEERLDGAAVDVIRVQDVQHRPGGGGGSRAGVRPANLAYVIYTSGSTGRPKGVMVPHEGIVNRLVWMQREYGLEVGEGVLHKTTVGFDVSLWELFWPLVAGARMVLARPRGHLDARYLWELVRRERVSTVHFVPTMLRVFLDERPASAAVPRRVLCSGEALPSDLERRCLVELGTELHNLYGPTEASVDVTFHRCRGEGMVVPIGTPIANTRAFVVTDGLALASDGGEGELYVGGVALARGYRGRPDLTAERFVPDPFGAGPGARLYRTGDLASWRDGRLEYAGRVDRQIKLRGQRIEPGEIEAALRRQPGVADAVVRLRQSGGETTLVAYLERGILWRRTADVREALRRELPDYMVPRAWVVLDELPVTPSGKVDWSALPEPGVDEPQPEYVAPRDELEEQVAGIWAEVFALDRVGATDDFYELGGHSLLAAQIATRLEALVPVPITVAQVLNCPTVAELAAFIRAWKPGDDGERGRAAVP